MAEEVSYALQRLLTNGTWQDIYVGRKAEYKYPALVHAAAKKSNWFGLREDIQVRMCKKVKIVTETEVEYDCSSIRKSY